MSNSARSKNELEMKGQSQQTLIVVSDDSGMKKKVRINKCLVVLMVLTIIALTGLCIGLYFIGESAGAANAAAQTPPPDAITVRPISTTTSKPFNPPDVKPTPNLGFLLPRPVLPVHYRFTLFPNFYLPNNADFYFQGWGIITIKVQTMRTDRFFIHGDRLDIDLNSVELFKYLPDDEEPLPFGRRYTRTENKSDIVLKASYFHQQYSYYEFVFNDTLEASREYKLRLEWRGKLARDYYGLYWSRYLDGNQYRYQIATQFESVYARKAFPCFDEPDMKALFETRLVRKNDFTSLGNTFPRLVSVVMIDREVYNIDVYRETIPMPTYLLAFTVHQYAMLTDVDRRTGTLYRFWGRPEWLHRMYYIANISKSIMNHFDEYYGTEYPFAKIDFIAFPDFSAGAMENWGLIMFAESTFYYDPERDPFSQKERVASVTAHELGHFLFGNIVTTWWWEDIWLNEGFASMSEFVGMPAAEETWEMDERFLVSDVLSVMRSDCLNSTRPISMKVENRNDLSVMFDSITYSKGASLCRMMSGFLTETTFKKAISAYLNTYKYANAQRKNLFDALTAQTIAENKRVDMNAIMETWASQPGYPVVTAKLESIVVGIQRYLTISVSQEPFELDKGKFGERVWSIPLSAILSSRTNNVNWNIIGSNWLHTTTGTVRYIDSTITNNWNVSGWFILNADHTGYFRVNYDEVNWERIRTQLFNSHTVVSAQTRAQLIDDAYFLARGGYPVMDYYQALRLTGYLCLDTDYPPWQAMLDNINYLEQMFMRNTTEYEVITKFGRTIIYNVYNHVGWYGSMTEKSTNHFLRTSVVSRACRWRSEHCMNNSREAFAGWKANPNSNITTTDTFSSARCYGIKYGTHNDWLWLYDLYNKTTYQTDRNNYINALACSDDIATLTSFLHDSFTNVNISRSEFTTTYAAIAGNTIAYNMLKAFFFANWQVLLNSTVSSDPGRILTVTFQYVNTRGERDELLYWKQNVAGDLGTVEGSFNSLLVTINNNIMWMDNHASDVLQWIGEVPITPPSCGPAVHNW